MNICVYGAANKEIDRRFIDAGEELGRKMAGRGHVLIFGGGADGLMGAVARGVTEKKGKMISVVPAFFNADGILYDKSDKTIFTANMRERKAIMEKTADAFIMTPGGVGTYDEFFEMLTLSQLDQNKKPLAVLNVLNYFDPMQEMLISASKKGFLREITFNCYKMFSDSDSLLDYIENLKIN